MLQTSSFALAVEALFRVTAPTEESKAPMWLPEARAF
jgi:hypothetical protein